MGMFDWYEPQPGLACPVCGRALVEWQGKDGPCALLVWRQGAAEAVEQRVPEESRVAPERLKTWRLPEDFHIYSHACGCPYPVDATCRAQGGIWTETSVSTASTAWRYRNESKAEWAARKQWLSGRGRRTRG
jgi:hypothetical protein